MTEERRSTPNAHRPGGRRLEDCVRPGASFATVPELATHLGCTEELIWKQIKAGTIRPLKIGRKVIIHLDECRRFMAAAAYERSA